MESARSIVILLAIAAPWCVDLLITLNQTIAYPVVWEWRALAWIMGFATAGVVFWAAWLLFIQKPKKHQENHF